MATVNHPKRPCVICKGTEFVLLGTLGRYVNVCCRACGWEASFNAESDDTARAACEAAMEVVENA